MILYRIWKSGNFVVAKSPSSEKNVVNESFIVNEGDRIFCSSGRKIMRATIEKITVTGDIQYLKDNGAGRYTFTPTIVFKDYYLEQWLPKNERICKMCRTARIRLTKNGGLSRDHKCWSCK